MSLINPEFEKAAKILAGADDEVLQAAGMMAQMRLETLKMRLKGVAGAKSLTATPSTGDVFLFGTSKFGESQAQSTILTNTKTISSIWTPLPTAVTSQNQTVFPLSTSEKVDTNVTTSTDFTSQTQNTLPLSVPKNVDTSVKTSQSQRVLPLSTSEKMSATVATNTNSTSQTQRIFPLFTPKIVTTTVATNTSLTSQTQRIFPLFTPEKVTTTVATNTNSTSQTQRVLPLSTFEKVTTTVTTNKNSTSQTQTMSPLFVPNKEAFPKSQTQSVFPKTKATSEAQTDIFLFPEMKSAVEKVVPKVEPVAAREDFFGRLNQSAPKKEITKVESHDSFLVPWKKDHKDEDARSVSLVNQRTQRRLEIDPDLDFARGTTTNIFNRFDSYVQNTYIYNQRQLYQPQNLSLVLNVSPRVEYSRGFGGCGCKQIQCNDRRCGCRKSGAACGSGCLCASRGAWCLNR